MTGLRIGIAQVEISADPRLNGVAIREVMRAGAIGGARLVQFPEGNLSGYAKSQIASYDDVDWTAVSDELDTICRLAGELRIWVALGSAHQLTPPHRPHNSLYVISDAGEIVDRYDKRFLSNAETDHFFQPGFEPTIFEVDGIRFGCALCIEVNFPDLFAEYERSGVDCVLLSAYPVDATYAVKARAHAAICNYWVALSAPEQTRDLYPAMMIGPDGDILVEAGAQDSMVLADIDRTNPAFHVALDLARPWRARVRDGEVYRTLRVSDPRSSDRTSGRTAAPRTSAG